MTIMEKIEFMLTALSSLGTIVALLTLTYQVVKETIEKKEEQANNVSTWIDNEYISDNETYSCLRAVVICNQSNFPIYEVVFSIDDLYSGNGDVGTGIENCSCIDILPPGKYVAEVDFDGPGMNHKFSSSITFRDHFGRYWTRDVNGKLIQEKGKDVICNRRKICRPYLGAYYRKIAD